MGSCPRLCVGSGADRGPRGGGSGTGSGPRGWVGAQGPIVVPEGGLWAQWWSQGDGGLEAGSRPRRWMSQGLVVVTEDDMVPGVGFRDG